MRRLACLLIALLPALGHAEDVTVYAAASLTNALNDINRSYEAKHAGTAIKASYASSGTLAKQIDAGAPAQIFASADEKWMDFLQGHSRIDSASRRPLLNNTLVLIAPKAQPLKVNLQKGGDLPTAFTGKLCTGETASVPVGIYAKEALTNLGYWGALEKRIVGTEDVRSALAFVERGECPLGIVYQTDAKISDKVTVVATFPESSHKPVVYPFALVNGASATAKDYFQYLQSADAKAVFEKYGFVVK